MESSANTPRLNLPTLLTLSRIVVIPIFILATPGNPIMGAVIFSLASITDFLDGYLARRSGQVTRFGIILDPIADKFLVISALILLVDLGAVSIWIAIIIIAREFLVTGLRVVALSKDMVIKAEMGGKLKTTAQIAAIICLILGRSITPLTEFGIDLFDIGTVLIWAAVVLAIVSGVQYTLAFWRKFLTTAL
ncbi:MAG: CDP-diacylglycerol--glycerol-3-phosphate 3-phosphatidyltransferase [Thermodesulfovibrionales bacterium]|nr:CDP-diacylglycerol--glycerol-3-phosphate 3-phosphatidyltransferase [Thermodesulfovibrionales bacterium]